jgi:hypothetical protein
MDLRTLTKLLLKLAGLYLLVTSLLVLPSLLFVPFEHSGPGLVSAGVFSLIGLGLLLFPGAVANQVIRIPPDETRGAPTAESLFRVGLTLMGVYLVVDAVFRVVFVYAKSRWFYDYMQPFPGSRGPGLTPDDFGTLAAAGVQILFGIVLWLANRRVSRITGKFTDSR